MERNALILSRVSWSSPTFGFFPFALYAKCKLMCQFYRVCWQRGAAIGETTPIAETKGIRSPSASFDEGSRTARTIEQTLNGGSSNEGSFPF